MSPGRCGSGRVPIRPDRLADGFIADFKGRKESLNESYVARLLSSDVNIRRARQRKYALRDLTKGISVRQSTVSYDSRTSSDPHCGRSGNVREESHEDGVQGDRISTLDAYTLGPDYRDQNARACSRLRPHSAAEATSRASTRLVPRRAIWHRRPHAPACDRGGARRLRKRADTGKWEVHYRRGRKYPDRSRSAENLTQRRSRRRCSARENAGTRSISTVVGRRLPSTARCTGGDTSRSSRKTHGTRTGRRGRITYSPALGRLPAAGTWYACAVDQLRADIAEESG